MMLCETAEFLNQHVRNSEHILFGRQRETYEFVFELLELCRVDLGHAHSFDSYRLVAEHSTKHSAEAAFPCKFAIY